MSGGFVPWSLPAAVGLAGGIVLAAQARPVGLLLALPLLALVRRSNWTLWLLIFLAAGYLRYAHWHGRPDPLAQLIGQELVVSGWSDGRQLRLDEPRGVEVVLSPAGAVATGPATVRGRLERPRGRRNPGGFDYRGYLRRRGVTAQLFVEEVLASRPTTTVRERFRRGVVRGLEHRQAALMQAMTLGIRDDLGALRTVFAASGLAHVLALSGLHVGVLMLALGLLLRPLGPRRYPLMLLAVVGFVALVGVSPSVLRAASMVAAALLALWFGAGRIEVWPTLALAGILTLLYNPSWLFDLSFQLSYLAVVGMLLFTPPLMGRVLGAAPRAFPWWHWRKVVLGSVVASSAAQALSLPLVASAFGSLPLFSPWVNVLAVPLATVLVPLGFLAALSGLVSLSLAGLVNRLTGALAGLLLRLADVAAGFPTLVWGEVEPIGYGLFYLGVAGIALAVRGAIRPWRGLSVASTAMLASMVAIPAHPPPEVIFMDVGQGDSVLIRLPGRHEILVDGGGTPFSDFDVGARTVVPALRALGVDELELVVASHADADHIEGLAAVLASVAVGELVIGVPEPDRSVFRALIAVAESRRVPIRTVVRGEVLEVGAARLEILNPPRQPFGATNDNSVAFSLWWRGRSVALFLGDLPARVERDLAVPDVELLMVPHHGSSSSSSAWLLEASRPERAVVSVGRNGFGHPHGQVMERLGRYGVAVETTWDQGAVRIPLDP